MNILIFWKLVENYYGTSGILIKIVTALMKKKNNVFYEYV